MKNIVSIKLLGMGDARYRRVKSNLLEALQHFHIETPPEEINDLDSILQYPVSAVPAIIVEQKIIFEHGDVPSVEQLEILLQDALAEKIN